MSIQPEEISSYTHAVPGGETEAERLAREDAAETAREKEAAEAARALRDEHPAEQDETKPEWQELVSQDGSRRLRVSGDANRAEVDTATQRVKIYTAAGGKAENAESYYTVQATGKADAVDMSHVALPGDEAQNADAVPPGMSLRDGNGALIFVAKVDAAGALQMEVHNQAALTSRIEKGREYVFKAPNGSIQALNAEGQLVEATAEQKELFTTPDSYGAAPEVAEQARLAAEAARTQGVTPAGEPPATQDTIVPPSTPLQQQPDREYDPGRHSRV